MIGWVLVGAGGAICLLNFFLGWVRYPLHRARGGRKEDYRWVSGFPLVGSIAVLAGWFFWLRHEASLALDAAAWLLVIFDTGGIHWLAASLAFRRLRDGKSGE